MSIIILSIIYLLIVFILKKLYNYGLITLAKKVLKEIIEFILDWRTFVSFMIIWMFTNGWAYAFMIIGPKLHIKWMTIVGTSLTAAPELPATTLTIYCYEEMFRGCTSFKVSATKTGTYQYSWRIPTSGTGTTATSWNTSMLSNTGGTFTGNPTINTTYYLENAPV